MDKGDIHIWLLALSRGDDSAYKVLFDHYFFPLCSFGAKYLDNIEAAEDIVQDVFFEFWQKKTLFTSEVALKTYFYRTVRNRCLDLLKHRKVINKYNTEQSLREDTEFFLHQILEEEVYIALKGAIDGLPDQTRKIYEMTLLGRSNQEIADALNLSLDAVKSKKKRGKDMLQERLKNMFTLLVPLFIP